MQISPDLIDRIYESVLDPGLMPHVLGELADTFRAGATVLLFQNQVTMHSSAITVRMDDRALGLFNDYYAVRNPMTARNNLAAIRAWKELPVNLDEDILEKREYQRTEYYNDFGAPNGLHHVMTAALSVHGESIATLNLARSRTKEQFAPGEVAAMRALKTHVARAFRISSALAEARQANGALRETMERSRHGLFLLDESGRIQYANGRGIAMLGDGLLTSNGELCAYHPEESRKLRASIQRACSRDAARRSSGALSLSRDDRGPLNVIVTPLSRESEFFLATSPAALVYITDPEAGILLPAEGLRELFGLTAAETAVAMELLGGYDIKGVAQRLAISHHTVRVHLARIMSKTNTNRQAALVRLLMSLMGL